MGALTDAVPKPLLKVGGRYLIEHSILSLVKGGVRDIVINVCYRGDQIKAALGDGSRYGATFYFSEEEEALETGGGILKVLDFFGDDPFVVLSSDVVSEYSLLDLPSAPRGLAHLVMVENPVYHPRGDFCLAGDHVFLAEQNRLTFANIGVYRRELFRDCLPGKFRLGDLLIEAIKQEKVSGEIYRGVWHNLGTPADLEKVYLGA